MRRLSRLCAVSLLVAATLPVAHAQVRIQRVPYGIRVEAHKATMAQVLAALEQKYHLSVRGATADGAVDETFEGSLYYVLKRVLDSYDYVVEHDGRALVVIVLGGKTQRPAAPPAVPPVVVRRRAD